MPFLHTDTRDAVTLPGLMALLVQDSVDSYAALRPHQAPAWHMFLVQLAALAIHRAGIDELPANEEKWTQLLRGLTQDFLHDEPWCLVVDDPNKPAFMQPAVPQDVKINTPVPTPDALDLLITSRNHDLKQKIAHHAEIEDWVLALVSLQTGEGFGGAKNYGIVRMNGGSSSRPMLSLAPIYISSAKANQPRPGAWFCRDVLVLLATREEEMESFSHIGYPTQNGIGLVWTVDWPEGVLLQLQELDLWFIEICRRIRFSTEAAQIHCARGTSNAPRISAKKEQGAVGDPWGPIHKTEGKSFTLSSSDFDYAKLIELLFSGTWTLPRLARTTLQEHKCGSMAVVAQALSRGNSKTEGFKSRILPIGGRIVPALGARRVELNTLAKSQVDAIKKFDIAMRDAFVLVAAKGDIEKRSTKYYAFTNTPRAIFDHAVDAIFFEHLWARFEAQDKGPDSVEAETRCFIKRLNELAWEIFESALPAIPCAKLLRPRAEARSRRCFRNALWKTFPSLQSVETIKEESDADA